MVGCGSGSRSHPSFRLGNIRGTIRFQPKFKFTKMSHETGVSKQKELSGENVGKCTISVDRYGTCYFTTKVPNLNIPAFDSKIIRMIRVGKLVQLLTQGGGDYIIYVSWYIPFIFFY